MASEFISGEKLMKREDWESLDLLKRIRDGRLKAIHPISDKKIVDVNTLPKACEFIEISVAESLYGVTEEGKRTREAQKKESEQSYNLDLHKFGVDKNFDELLAEERENFTALSEDAVLDYVISIYDSFIEYVNDITVDEKSTQHVLSQEMHDEFPVGEFNGVITNDEDMLFDCDDPERYAELEREIEERKRSTARIHSLSEYVAAGGIDRDKTPMRDGPVIARGMKDPFLQAKCALKAWYQANDAKKFRTIAEDMLDNPKNVIRIVPEGCVAVDFENLPAGFPPIEAWLFPQQDTPKPDTGETAAPEPEACVSVDGTETGGVEQEAGETEKESIAVCTFRIENEVCHITYAGHEYVFGKLNGHVYISELLHRPGETIPVCALYSIVNPPPEIVPVDKDSEGLSTQIVFQEVLDKEGIRTISEEISNKKYEMSSCVDLERRAELEDEIDKLEKYLSGSTHNKGSKTFSDQTEKARINVSRAIDRAIDKISKENEELAKYLKKTIRYGAECIYRPDEAHN
ncbi:MAG: hypothetical protein PWQ57_1225 [Desulfovibrionales bacterium]|nr:hypothetical protein [Desulfovibrionales bacterium]